MSNYIQHHGIKGQKWGVRRYQNSDGSLTATGQMRYAKKAYKKSQDDAFAKYEKTIHKIEKPYKKGEKLSRDDRRKERDAEKRYESDRENNKNKYEKSKSEYKSKTALNDSQRKVRLGATVVASILTTPIGGAAVAYGTTKYMRSKNDIARINKGEAKVKDILQNMTGIELYEKN